MCARRHQGAASSRCSVTLQMLRGGYQQAHGFMRGGRGGRGHGGGGGMREAPETPPKGKVTTPIGAKARNAAAVKVPPAPCIKHQELRGRDKQCLHVAPRAERPASAPVSTCRKTLSPVALPKPGPAATDLRAQEWKLTPVLPKRTLSLGLRHVLFNGHHAAKESGLRFLIFVLKMFMLTLLYLLIFVQVEL